MDTTTPKPYPEYNPSGVDWLGDVPRHWRVGKLRHILKDTTTRNRPDLPLLSVVREKGVILRDIEDKEENHNFIPDDLSNYKVVDAGQLAMNKMKAWQGSFGVSRFNGIVSPAYFTFDVKGVKSDFFHKAIRSRAYVPFFTQASDGVRIGQWDLSKERMQEIPFFVPPDNEQQEIVRYLDRADERMQRAISAKERLIELLTEQRQAIIQHAVTRGLDPNVRLRDSGVEWLGGVPEHWELLPGRACYEEKPPQINVGLQETTVLSLSYGQIVIKPPEKLHGLVPASFETYQIVEPNDIIVRPTDLQNDWNSLRFGLSRHRGIITSAYMCLATSAYLSFEYGYLLCHAYDLKKVFYGLGSGLRQNLSWKDFKYLPCVVPSYDEQTAIVRYIDKATADINVAINNARCQIDVLREYRTRLIADVVTGQVDVRDAVVS